MSHNIPMTLSVATMALTITRTVTAAKQERLPGFEVSGAPLLYLCPTGWENRFEFDVNGTYVLAESQELAQTYWYRDGYEGDGGAKASSSSAEIYHRINGFDFKSNFKQFTPFIIKTGGLFYLSVPRVRDEHYGGHRVNKMKEGEPYYIKYGGMSTQLVRWDSCPANRMSNFQYVSRDHNAKIMTADQFLDKDHMENCEIKKCVVAKGSRKNFLDKPPFDEEWFFRISDHPTGIFVGMSAAAILSFWWWMV